MVMLPPSPTETESISMAGPRMLAPVAGAGVPPFGAGTVVVAIEAIDLLIIFQCFLLIIFLRLLFFDLFLAKNGFLFSGGISFSTILGSAKFVRLGAGFGRRKNPSNSVQKSVEAVRWNLYLYFTYFSLYLHKFFFFNKKRISQRIANVQTSPYMRYCLFSTIFCFPESSSPLSFAFYLRRMYLKSTFASPLFCA